MGSNRAVLRWAEQVRTHYRLTASCFDVLRVVATHMGAEAWDDMRLCIAWITERVSWSRRTVERALQCLRQNFLLRQDGEIPVESGRPVVRYRLGGTPECPLPWDVVEARETAGQGGNGVYTSTTGPSVLVEDQGDTAEEPPSISTSRGSNYRSASPIKTGPHEYRSGTARRVTHLRWLRSFAAGVVGRAGTRVPTSGPEVSQDGSCGFAGASSGAAVTYCHTPMKGEAVNPFTDPALGALPRDTRLFYLGLLELHSRCGDRTPSDEMFLWAELFRYDQDITQRDITRMKQQLIKAGKIHQVAGDIVLADPPASNKEIALFEPVKKVVTSTVRSRTKTAVEDPWFASFWDAYPRRTGKGAARKAFAAAVAAGADPQVIVATASAYGDRCHQLQKEPQFVPHPATWLNQERWEDDEEQAPRVRSKVDDALRSGMDLVNFYQQQEAIPFDGPKELGW
jgi:hypothetical protein